MSTLRIAMHQMTFTGFFALSTFAPLECAETNPAFSPKVDVVRGVMETLDPTVVEGTVVAIEGPPNHRRDCGRPSEKDQLSAAYGETILAPRRALADGAYARARRNWLTVQHPDVNLQTIAALAKQKYDQLITAHVASPKLTGIDVEPMTLVYPAGYDGNVRPVRVRARRLAIHAVDRWGDERHLVAYYLAYDKVDSDSPTVIFQIHGHFGRNPSRQAVGLENRGGLIGGVLGILAMRGYPLIVFDDHNVGESSSATHKENGLYRTLGNLRMIDDSLLVYFDRVDGIGLSGGCERLYHFLALHRCRLRSAYQAGLFASPWIRMDSRKRTGGPFGSDADTDNEIFQTHFQYSDLALVGIANGIDVAFVNQTVESGLHKNAFLSEMLPSIRQYTDRYESRGDDHDGDGVSNSGRRLCHEYDLEDYIDFLGKSRE